MNDGLSKFSTDVSCGLPSSWDWQQPVIIGVSGGADSMALLFSLAELSRQEENPSVAVAHVEYDLRPEATRDREFVVRHARGLGFPCYWIKVCVREAAKKQPGLGTEPLRLVQDMLPLVIPVMIRQKQYCIVFCVELASVGWRVWQEHESSAKV